MKKKELEKRLNKENIRRDAYWLEGGLPNEAYCLGRNGNLWEVYYSERGNKRELKVFDSEEKACDYFYLWLFESLKDMGLL